ncbi:type II toxin-antitoxin system HicB family antitoxin [Stutzerimonas sp.]|uniref:type II toxin-antitoxin system HicB family antitoxin n=1 Tax=Stutzerimonas sp. TaxID=2901166 RepID=UPI0035B38D79
MEYVVVIEHDETGAVLVTCPDIPEFASVGDDEDEALLNAVDGLETALEIYIQDRRAWPEPASSVAPGERTVALPALATTKALLHNEMLSQGVRKAELARRLHVAMPQVDRLLDVRHKSRLDGIEHAFESLGKRLVVALA